MVSSSLRETKTSSLTDPILKFPVAHIMKTNSIKETGPTSARRGTSVRQNGKIFKFRRKLTTFFEISTCSLITLLLILPYESFGSEERDHSKLQNSFHNSKITNRTIPNEPFFPFIAPNTTSTSTTTTTTVAPSKVCRPPCSNGACDSSSGTCTCNPGWRGDQCDLCGGKIK